MSVYAPSVDYLWELARNAGLDPEPIFIEAGVDPTLRFDTSARIPRELMNALHVGLWRASGDDTIGLRVGSVFHPSHMGPLGYAWLASADLRSALGKVRRFSRLEADTFVLTLADHLAECHIGFYWQADWEPIPPQIYMVAALLTHLMRCLVGQDFVPLRVELSTPAPDATEAFDTFFGVRPEFGRAGDLLVVPADLMTRPLPRSHAELERVTDEVVVRYLADRKRADVVSQARAALFELLPEGTVDSNSVAERLNLSARTFRRRLEGEGLTFRSLLSDVRHELALRYVRDPTLSLTEISYLLGFSEPSAFSRAFRGWTGQSPSAARSPDG